MKKIALIGCGNWGKNIARSLGELESLAAICDPDSSSLHAQTYRDRFNVPLLSVDEILSNPQIEGVVIATPTATHFSLCKKGLEAQKHVFVEKPMVQDLTQNRELCALAKSKKRTLMVGHILRYHPGYLTLKRLCQEGAIGSVGHITTRRCNLGRFFPGESALWDFSPHDLSMVLGLMERLPLNVSCQEHSYVEEGVGDFASLTLDFGQNQHAHLYFSRLSPYKEQVLVVQGKTGFLSFDDTRDWSEKVTWYKSHVRPAPTKPEIQLNPLEFITLEAAEPLKLELQSFMKAMEDPTHNQSDSGQALDILKIILAAERSLKEKTWVPLTS